MFFLQKKHIFLLAIVVFSAVFFISYFDNKTTNPSPSHTSNVPTLLPTTPKDSGSFYTPTYAKRFRIDSLGSALLLHIFNPWVNAKKGFKYILIPPNGTLPAVLPDSLAGVMQLHIPLQKIVTLSTTFLGHFELLNATHRIIAVSNAKLINTPSVLKAIDSGSVVEIGEYGSLNLEQLFKLQPDAILSYGTGNPEYDNHPKILDAKLPLILTSAYMEEHPLGRAEWLVLYGLLTNNYQKSNSLFKQIVADYKSLQKLATVADSSKPIVMTGSPFQGSWHVAGGQSYMASLIRDAGGTYLWEHYPGAGSVNLSSEIILQQSEQAQIWLNPGHWSNLQTLEQEYPEVANIKPWQTKQVYSNNKQLNSHGGNAYFETGAVRPDLVLKDIISVFHPNLLPEHPLLWHRRLHP
jgi:iron complex transport system substrate-binding protein